MPNPPVDNNKQSGTAAEPSDNRYSRGDYAQETRDTVRDVKSAVTKGKKKMSDAMETTTDDLAEAANHAGQRIRDYLTGRKDDIQDVTEAYSDAVRAKPIQSSLLALGAGFLIASLLRRF